MRKRLPRESAEAQYLDAGEMEVFRQLQRDAIRLDGGLPDGGAIPLGPFARVQAEDVLSGLGKTRGAINNLWGNQEMYRAAIMASFLHDASLGLEDAEFPKPSAAASLDDWLDRVAEVEIGRGPRHGAQPQSTYGFRWAAWLGLAPYGLWSETIAEASLGEYRQRVERFADELIGPALRQFDLSLSPPFSLRDLSAAFVSLVEGHWLNALLSPNDPMGGKQRIEATLAKALRMLFAGAVRPTKTRQPGPRRTARVTRRTRAGNSTRKR